MQIPEVISQNLAVLFCGINPSLNAARSGIAFAHPSNRFWHTLFLAGFTDIRLAPVDQRRLLEYSCGLTTVVSRATSRAEGVTKAELIAGRPALEAKIRHHSPRFVAFLGRRAFGLMTNRPDVAWGRQPVGFGGANAWVLPNPSGLNRGFCLEDLVTAYQELRVSAGPAIEAALSRRRAAPQD